MLPNGPAFVTAFFAITGLGAIVAPTNPAFKADERDFCFRACDVREVIADVETVDRLIDEHAGRRLEPRSPEETFVYQFSSGSTGRPSGSRGRTGSCGPRPTATRTSPRKTGCSARSRCSTPTGWAAA